MAAQRIKNLGDELQEQSLAVIPAPEATVTVETDSIGTTKVTVSRILKINMGNFEGVECFASIQRELPNSVDFTLLADELSGNLDILQTPELMTAQQFTKEHRSFVHGFVFEDE